ncbi:RDD family protein [Methanobrevibacter sp.]|uniref:RDD family protein n=1 Tax=Methanobrevibacter sp. TaxID=66852 RepID=UPI0025CFA205|nr:RDD family protein [Methanobrevibacter sp.]MBR4447411.1 RDD family protein [Methanobrevibacter sp.]
MATVFTRRVIAYVVDFFVVSAIMWILSYFIFAVMTPSTVHIVYQYLPYLVPILIMIYFVLCEKYFGATVGKSVMYIQVKSQNGSDLSWPQAVVRNLTKIYWVPIIFDWLIGRFLNTDRILGNITRTVVINDNR